MIEKERERVRKSERGSKLIIGHIIDIAFHAREKDKEREREIRF